MQSSPYFLWPPPQRGTSPQAIQQDYTSSSDIEDDQHVERLINPYKAPENSSYFGLFSSEGSEMLQSSPTPGQQVNGSITQAPSLVANIPTISLNSIPFSRPIIEVSRESSPVLVPPQPERAASPRGNKRSSPQPSADRGSRHGISQGGFASEGSSAAKVRLVGIPDLQQGSLIERLSQQANMTAEFLQNFKNDMASVKASTEAVKQLVEKADKKAEQRLLTLKAEIEEQTSKQIHDAEKRLEEMVKRMKNIEQASRPRQIEDNVAQETMTDDMVVENEQPQHSQAVEKGKQRAMDNGSSSTSTTQQVTAPLRFPEPPQRRQLSNKTVEGSKLPPSTFKRPKSKGKEKSDTIPRLHKMFLRDSDCAENDSSSSTSDDGDDLPRHMPKLNISDLNGEDVMKLLLTSIGIDVASIRPINRNGRRRAHPDFKEPAKKTPKAKGKQSLMNWLRQQLHTLLDIEKSRDILKSASEIYSANTPVQRQMEQWEKTMEGVGPQLKPMKINWKSFDGPWNTRLCELFVQHCASEGFGEGNPSDEAQDFIACYFWERLARLRTIVKKNKPKDNETFEQTSVRIEEQHLQLLGVARRNSRRNQKHSDRIDICLENLPENTASIATEEQREWKTRYDVVMALGPEGVSSDETDENDADNYWVRTLPWRSQRATRVMIDIDDAKNTTNAYGNIRAGNRPRNRQRRRNATASVRKVPTGKPENIYDPDWFAGLNSGKKRALKVKTSIEYGQ